MSDDVPVQAESKVGDLRGVLPAGTSLRGYELKSILGQGAFGITYRARDTTLHRDVAIKEYLPTSLALREGRTTVLPRSPEHAEQFAWGRERFLDEARTLARLDRTPAIVRVHDFLEANGTAYMVMALVEGETLHKRLMREQRLAPEAIERLIFPLLDGLEEVHAIGFLHRDIKPANIMVDSRGRPTLIDFGAARAAMAGRSTTMTAIFTPGYAAVEQYTSAKLGPWTDVYGLAATVYHAITGRIPPSSIDRVLQDTYQPLSELRPEGYAPELLAGIDAGMARHVDDRPQTIAEWRQVLRTGEHRPSAQETTQVEHKPRRLAGAASRSRNSGIALRGPALWGAIAGVLMLVAGGGYFAFVANSSGSVSGAAQILTAEQLEQALAERRKADSLAAEKMRLVEEAQRRVVADAEAKRQADAELEQARQARQKAEQELAQLKADIEAQRQAQTGQRNQQAEAEQRATEEAAQRKAEAEAAALRQAEEEAQKKAAAEAEAKRQADEALVKAEADKQRADADAAKMAEAEEAKRKADEEARQKADAEAKQKGDAAAIQKAAEANEKALRLEQVDRQRLQVALTSLGYDTRGTDGVLGPRSREMIASWQKARNQPATGYLGALEQKALLKDAAVAVGKFDDEQKKADDEKKAAEEARARTAAAVARPTGGSTPSSADGLWRGTYECGRDGNTTPFTLNPAFRVINGSGTWYPATTSRNETAGRSDTMSLQISIDGPDVIARRFRVESPNVPSATTSGRIDGDLIRASSKFCTLSLTRDPSSAPAASSPYDGTYALTTVPITQNNSFTGPVTLTLRVMRGSGQLAISYKGCTTSQFDVTISPAGDVSGQGDLKCIIQGTPVRQGGSPMVTLAGPLTIGGRIADRKATLRLSSGRGSGSFDLPLSAN